MEYGGGVGKQREDNNICISKQIKFYENYFIIVDKSSVYKLKYKSYIKKKFIIILKHTYRVPNLLKD